MKKFYSFVAVLATTLTFAQTNLVQNPGFDNDLTSWSKGPATAYTLPTIFEDGYQSSNSAGYNAATGTTGFYQNVPVEPGKSYELSFWYKATGDDSDARLWSFLKDASGSNVYLYETVNDDPLRSYNGYLPTASAWSLHTVEFTNTTATTLELALRSYSGSNTAYDEFSLVEKVLGTGDVVKTKYTLVANSLVTSDIHFAATSKNVQIINSNGQVVKTASVNEGTKLSLSSLAKGVYIVTGEVNGQMVSQKIIKK